MPDDFIPLKEYVVKDKSDGKTYRMFGVLSFNRYGDQAQEKFSFHVLTKTGFRIISGRNAELLPLRWWQKDTIVASIIGGTMGITGVVIGVILRELIPLITRLVTNLLK